MTQSPFVVENMLASRSGMISESVLSLAEASVENESQNLFAIFAAASTISEFRGALPVVDESFRAHLSWQLDDLSHQCAMSRRSFGFLQKVPAPWYQHLCSLIDSWEAGLALPAHVCNAT